MKCVVDIYAYLRIYEVMNTLEQLKLTDEDLRNLSEIFGALSSEKRLKIVELLSSDSYSVSQLAHLMDCTPTCVSQHLAILRTKKIVIYEKKGQEVIYSLNMKCIFLCVGCVLDHFKR